jgi:uncharacterized RDD family membrane protein YckC
VSRPAKPATGVYFWPGDYAPLWKRFLVDIADMAVAGIAWLVVFLFALPSLDLALAICAVLGFLYFVPLKRSRFRTLGYRLGGVRIVGLDGRPPGYFALTMRLVFALLGPLNWLMDLMFLSGDPHRQALRDKFAQTYVVRKDAEAAGQGKLVYRYYEILVYNFLFREVEIPKADSQAVG